MCFGMTEKLVCLVWLSKNIPVFCRVDGCQPEFHWNFGMGYPFALMIEKLVCLVWVIMTVQGFFSTNKHTETYTIFTEIYWNIGIGYFFVSLIVE